MVKNALGHSAFYGRGEPQSLITDNCEAERKALAVTWPTAQHFLCIFYILQQVWRWLLNSKNGIQKAHRQELMASMKTLMYSKTREDFSEVWEKFQTNSLGMTYPNFLRYSIIFNSLYLQGICYTMQTIVTVAYNL